MALRWKKDKRPTGLAGVAMLNELGSTLSDGDTRYATVSNLRGGGWYYVCGWDSGVPHFNSSSGPSPDEATAKAEAMAYVRENLKSQQRAK